IFFFFYFYFILYISIYSIIIIILIFLVVPIFLCNMSWFISYSFSGSLCHSFVYQYYLVLLWYFYFPVSILSDILSEIFIP
ncbi:hypothetical protein H8356DRAFT_1733178, partial [Neocallimastix lanati (nom. inval.)]